MAQVAHTINKAGVAASEWQDQRSAQPGAWAVATIKFPNKEFGQRKEETYKRMRINFEYLAGPPEEVPTMVLSRHGSEKAAEAALEAMSQRALKGLRDEEKRLKAELKEVNDAMRRSGGNLTWIINRQSELENSLAGVNRQMERQRSILARQAQVARVSARGQQLQSAGTNNMVTGTAMLSPFILAGKAAMDFSSGTVVFSA